MTVLSLTSWSATLTAHLPGASAAARLDSGVLRVAVVELPRLTPEALRSSLSRSSDLSTPQALSALLRLGGRGARPSAAVADIAPDGTLSLVARDAPPAVILSPDRSSRTLITPVRARLRPTESLLLCSATFFENPPKPLSELRDARLSPSAVQSLQGRLSKSPTGATALITQTP